MGFAFQLDSEIVLEIDYTLTVEIEVTTLTCSSILQKVRSIYIHAVYLDNDNFHQIQYK